MAKKPFIRWLIIGAALVVVLLVVGLAVALNSGVQTSVALKFLRQKDPNAKLERVALGLGGGEVSGVEMSVAGRKVKMDHATLQYSLVGLIFGGTKVIDNVEVKGLVLDVSQPAPASASGASPAAAGKAGALTAVLVKKFQILATVTLPNQRALQVSLNGHDLGAGSTGKATGELIFQDNSPSAKVREMRADTQLDLTCDSSMFPQNLDLTTELSATLLSQAAPARLQAHLQAKPQGASQDQFSLVLSQPGAAQLLSAKGTFSLNGAASGDFTADLSRAQIEPFALGFALPDFTARGQGQFSADTAKGEGSFKATLQGRAGHLETVRPGLEAVGNVQFNAAADLDFAKSKLVGRTLSFTLAPENGATAVSLELVKPVTIEFANGTPKLTQGSGLELARLTLTQAPAGWLTAGLPAGLGASGQGLSGQIILGTREDGAIVASTPQPLSLPGLLVKRGQDVVFPGADLGIGIAFDVAYSPKTIEVASFQATLARGQAVLASVKTLQKISLSKKDSGGFEPPVAQGDLAGIETSGLPVALAEAFLPEGLKVAGEVAQGRIVVAGAGAGGTGLVLRAEQPMVITNLQVAQSGEARLAGVTVTATPQGSWLAGDIKANVHLQATSAAGVLLDAVLDAASVKGDLIAVVSASGTLGAFAAQPLGAAWRAMLSDPKPQYEISARIAKTPTALSIQTAEAHIVPAGGAGAALAEMKLAQAVTLTSLPKGVTNDKAIIKIANYAWPQLNGDVVSVNLNSVPAGVLGLAVPGYRLSGRGITGSVIVRGSGNGEYVVVAGGPFTAAGLTVDKIQGSQPPAGMVRDLTFSLRPGAKFSDKGVSSISALDLRATSGGVDLAQGSVEMTRLAGQTLPQQAKITLSADLAQLFNQPILSKYNNLSAGQLTVDGELAQDGNLKLNADVSAWVVRAKAGTPPATTAAPAAPPAALHWSFANITGKINPGGGAMQLNIPIKGQSPAGTTDCTIAVSLDMTTAARKFDLNINGPSLVIDDLMAVKYGLFPPPVVVATVPGTPLPAAGPAPAVVADAAPMWGDVQGQVKVKVQRVAFNGFALDDLQVGAQVTPTQATLSSVTGQLFGSPLSVSGSLGFDKAQRAQPYLMQSKIGLKDFDTVTFFHNRDAKATAPVEGKFSIDGNAGGRGANINDLIARVQFDFKLNSTGGTFHVLDLNPNIGAGAKIAQVGTSIASALLGLAGKKVPGSLTFTNELLGYLNSIQYTKMAFEAQRGADLNVKITQLVVQNSEVDFNGTAQVTYQPGKAIPDQPLTATIQINAQGKGAHLFEQAGLMQASTAPGYHPGPQFHIGGTLQHPDYGELYTMIGKGAGSAIGRSLLGQ